MNSYPNLKPNSKPNLTPDLTPSLPPHFPTGLRAVLLDRDGVLNRKAPEGSYIRNPGELELLPGVKEAVRLLNQHQLLAIVVTNQRGIALGQMTEGDLESIHDSLKAQLAEGAAHLDAIYHCPHNYGECTCRKPQTGMLERALRDFPVATRENTILIGDSCIDMEAGKAFGIPTILISSDGASLLPAVMRIVGETRPMETTERQASCDKNIPGFLGV
jgi:D-glycero-D-manno-heptose 1,7-bisphosphate phosphatase